ncbi:MAG: hypothetical protein ABS951_00185 [Solibacillus sp.]
MDRIWILISYGAPFIVGVLVTLVGWLLVADKSFDVTVFGAIIFYSFPAYVFFIAPCYALVKSAIQKWQLCVVAAISLTLFLTVVQTMIAGQFLRVQAVGYLYVFIVFAVAACTFLLCLFVGKEIFNKGKNSLTE